MKSRVNLTVETSLLVQAKKYAANNNVSLSELVEQYFSGISEVKKGSDLIEFVKSLPKTKDSYPADVDFTKQYFEEKAEKYGF